VEIIAGLVGLAVGIVAAILVVKLIDRSRGQDAQRQAAEIVARGERDAENRKKEAELEIKERALAARTEGEKELNKVRQELHERERQLDKRQDSMEQQAELVRKQEKMVEASQRKLAEKTTEVTKRNEELNRLVEVQRKSLHEISGLSRDEATSRLMGALKQELEREAGLMVQKHEKHLQETCQAKSREVVITAIQRYAAAHTAETTTSTVDIPSDDMKGRIIGRDGRNIRAFEKATGVDVIIDDTPGVVVVSGFDAVRREVARMSLAKLIADGRIHPSRIEEVVGETQKEMDAHIMKVGNEAAQEVGLQGVHERIIQLLGRLHFRTSYSQNVLRHSVEVAFLTGNMAEEIGLDGNIARRAGLLHDIGKAADHEMEGGHPKIGADLLKRAGEREEVVHAALGHHDDLRIDRPYTVLVAAADACSASRPGARRETLERYVKRLEELEAVANGFPGVQQAYAIQAGRELRVIVSAQQTTDATAEKMCRDIAKGIEEQLTYPGEIKVTLLRESSFTEVAK